MNEFWMSFWPNLAATLVGIIVGVPIALGLNRLAERKVGQIRQSEERERLRTGLSAVQAALVHNRDRLLVLLDTLQQNKALFDVGIDTAAWEVSRDEIVPFLRNAALHRRIAFHFSRLNSLEHLCSLYLDRVAGIASALSGAEDVRDDLRKYLITFSTEMITQTITLCGEIETLLKAPKSSKNMGTLPRFFRGKPGKTWKT